METLKAMFSDKPQARDVKSRAFFFSFFAI